MLCIPRLMQGTTARDIMSGLRHSEPPEAQAPSPRQRGAWGFISDFTTALYQRDSSERHRFSTPQWTCHGDNYI